MVLKMLFSPYLIKPKLGTNVYMDKFCMDIQQVSIFLFLFIFLKDFLF